MTRDLSLNELLEGVLAGDRAALAQAITLVESSRPDHRERAKELLASCLPHTGNSIRIGITGIPGVGKSTFIEALGTYIMRERGESVAVLAIDPSSPLTGGSILGDKTRMPRLSTADSAFVRPSPSAGASGGVGATTRAAMLLCEAAGFRNIFVETVGAGQSEVAVAALVDFFLLLMLAGAGDELQGIKRGVLELANLVGFNKADANQVRSEAARRQLESVLTLFPLQPGGWRPPVLICSALTGDGIPQVWSAVLEHRSRMIAAGEFEKKRQQQGVQAMYDSIRRALSDAFFRNPQVRAQLQQLEKKVMEGSVDADAAAQSLLELWNRFGECA